MSQTRTPYVDINAANYTEQQQTAFSALNEIMEKLEEGGVTKERFQQFAAKVCLGTLCTLSKLPDLKIDQVIGRAGQSIDYPAEVKALCDDLPDSEEMNPYARAVRYLLQDQFDFHKLVRKTQGDFRDLEQSMLKRTNGLTDSFASSGNTISGILGAQASINAVCTEGVTQKDQYYEVVSEAVTKSYLESVIRCIVIPESMVEAENNRLHFVREMTKGYVVPPFYKHFDFSFPPATEIARLGIIASVAELANQHHIDISEPLARLEAGTFTAHAVSTKKKRSPSTLGEESGVRNDVPPVITPPKTLPCPVTSKGGSTLKTELTALCGMLHEANEADKIVHAALSQRALTTLFTAVHNNSDGQINAALDREKNADIDTALDQAAKALVTYAKTAGDTFKGQLLASPVLLTVLAARSLEVLDLGKSPVCGQLVKAEQGAVEIAHAHASERAYMVPLVVDEVVQCVGQDNRIASLVDALQVPLTSMGSAQVRKQQSLSVMASQ